MGFRSDPFMGTPGVPGVVSGPPVINLTYDEIRARGWKPLRDLQMPSGFVTVYPIVVKLANNEGEFLVYGDGSAQWTDYGTGHVSAPFMIK